MRLRQDMNDLLGMLLIHIDTDRWGAKIVLIMGKNSVRINDGAILEGTPDIRI